MSTDADYEYDEATDSYRRPGSGGSALGGFMFLVFVAVVAIGIATSQGHGGAILRVVGIGAAVILGGPLLITALVGASWDRPSRVLVAAPRPMIITGLAWLVWAGAMAGLAVLAVPVALLAGLLLWVPLLARRRGAKRANPVSFADVWRCEVIEIRGHWVGWLVAAAWAVGLWAILTRWDPLGVTSTLIGPAVLIVLGLLPAVVLTARIRREVDRIGGVRASAVMVLRDLLGVPESRIGACAYSVRDHGHTIAVGYTGAGASVLRASDSETELEVEDRLLRYAPGWMLRAISHGGAVFVSPVTPEVAERREVLVAFEGLVDRLGPVATGDPEVVGAASGPVLDGAPEAATSAAITGHPAVAQIELDGTSWAAAIGRRDDDTERETS